MQESRIREIDSPLRDHAFSTVRLCCSLSMLMCWAIALTVSLVDTSWGQQPQRVFDEDPQTASEWFLAPSRNVTRMMDQADELIGQQRYRDAILLLQQILEKNEDFFLKPNSELSLRNLISTKLLELPAAGREIYELEFGQEAGHLLKEYQSTQDEGYLSDVVRLYRSTLAGQAAMLTLLDLQFDQGEFLSSALLGEDLLRHNDLTDSAEVPLLWKTAISWQRCGRSDKAELHRATLKSRIAPHEFADRLAIITAAEQTAEHRQVGDSLFYDQPKTSTSASLDSGRPPHLVSGWLVPRGTNNRNASVGQVNSILIDKSMGQLTHLDTSGQPDRIEADTFLRHQITGARRHARSQAQLQAYYPIIAEDLVVTRTMWGATAYDLESGKRQWATAVHDLEYDFITNNSFSLPVVDDEYPETVKKYLIQKTLMNDITSGGLSSDGEHVFMIQNSGILGVRYAPMQSEHPIVPKSYNKLSAYDLSTGKLSWQLGGGHSAHQLDLAGVFFLGPPVAWNKLIFILGEINQEIRVFAIDPQSGRPRWSQPLALSSDPPEADILRRAQGLSVSIVDGILICPTGVGIVTAYDPLRRELLWNTYLYEREQRPLDDRNANIRFQLGSKNPYIQSQQKLRELIEADWMDYPVICTTREILVVSPEENALFCLDMNGGIRWKLPRNNLLFVAGIHDSAVMIYSDQQFFALKLEDGSPLWNQPIQIPNPSGMGVHSGDHYLLPVSGDRIWTIDLSRGRLLVETLLPENIPAGHLFSYHDQLLMHSGDQVYVFKAAQGVDKELADELAQSPQDSELWLKKGQFELQQRHDEEGIAALKRSFELNKNGPARDILALSLLENLRTDFLKTQEDLPLLRSLIHDPEMKSRLLVYTVDGLLADKQYDAAYDELSAHLNDPVQLDVLITTENNRAVRIDRWVDKKLFNLYQDASPALQKKMTTDLTAWVSDNAIGSPHATERFRHIPTLMLKLDAWTGSVLAHPSIDAVWLESHLITLRAHGAPPLAGWATARYAELIDQRKLPGWKFNLRRIVQELEERFPTVSCGTQTGAEVASVWQKKHPDIFLPGSDPLTLTHQQPQGKIVDDAQDSSHLRQLSRRNPIWIFHGEDSAFLGWDFAINESRNAILIKDSQHRLWYQIRIPHNVQFQDARNNYALTRGHLAVVIAGQTMTTFSLLHPRTSQGEAMWSETLEPMVSSIVEINRVFNDELPVISPLTSTFVSTMSDDFVQNLNSITGERLWRLQQLGSWSSTPRLFASHRYLIVSGRMLTEKRRSKGFLLDLIDGAIIRELTPQEAEFTWHAQQFGHSFWHWDNRNGCKLTVSRLTAQGVFESVIERDFDANAIYKQGYQGTHCFIAEPDGKFVVFDRQRLEVVVEGDLPVNFDSTLIGQMEFHEDLQHLYLLVPEEDLENHHVRGMNGLMSLMFSGSIVCYRLSDGEPVWTQSFAAHALDQDQPKSWPFLVLAANIQREDPLRPAQRQNFRRITLIDKQTGKILEGERDELSSHEQIHNYGVDTQKQEYEIFFSRNHSIKVRYENGQTVPVLEESDRVQNDF